MVVGSDIGDLQTIRSQTKTAIQRAIRHDGPVLVEAPPRAKKMEAALELVHKADQPFTYLAPRTRFYGLITGWTRNQSGLTAKTIPSPQRECPTFKGENEGESEKVAKLYDKGFSGAQIHHLDLVDTPCHQQRSGGPTCEYLQERESLTDGIENGELDLIVGNHRHARNDRYIEDRIVVVHGSNVSQFIDIFREENGGHNHASAENIVSRFLGKLATRHTDFPSNTFSTVSDTLSQEKKSRALSEALNWFEENGVGRQTVENLEVDNWDTIGIRAGHRLGPLLTLAFLTMEPIGPDFEIAPPLENTDFGQVKNTWENCEVHPNARFVRHQSSGEVYLLQPPNLDPAKNVIGLDVLPSKPLWDLVFGGKSGFDLRRVMPRENYDEYLSQVVERNVRRLGQGRYPYKSGEISDLDYHRFAIINSLEDEKLPLVTTSWALSEYQSSDWLSPFVKRAPEEPDSPWEDSEHMALSFSAARWSDAFDSESTGMVFGAPYPGHRVLRFWAAFFGETVDDLPERGTPSLDGVAGEIYDYFVSHRVFTTLLLFGEQDPGTNTEERTVYVTTDELPDWCPIEWSVRIERNTKATSLIEYLVTAANPESEYLAEQNVESVHEKLGLSRKYVHELFDSLEAAGVVSTSDRGAFGSTLYRWTGDNDLKKIDFLTDYSHTLRLDNKVYLLDL